MDKVAGTDSGPQSKKIINNFLYERIDVVYNGNMVTVKETVVSIVYKNILIYKNKCAAIKLTIIDIPELVSGTYKLIYGISIICVAMLKFSAPHEKKKKH